MTEELKQAAQQAISALQCAKRGHCDHAMADEAIAALERALTAAQPAQAGGVDGSIAASLGDIVAVWDQHAPSEYMTAQHMQAKRVLAGQQPVSLDMHGWCAYVGGMVAHWVTSEPDAHARLGDERFEAAIAGIIKRRLWAMPKPTQPAQAGEVDAKCQTCNGHGLVGGHMQDGSGYGEGCPDCNPEPAPLVKWASTQPAAQDTPEPVGEPVAWRYKIPTHGGGTAWTHTRPQPECLIEAQPLYTHPAPGVPDVEDLRDRLVAISAAVADSDDRAAQAMLGEILRALAAAQAKGGGACVTPT